MTNTADEHYQRTGHKVLEIGKKTKSNHHHLLNNDVLCLAYIRHKCSECEWETDWELRGLIDSHGLKVAPIMVKED